MAPLLFFFPILLFNFHFQIAHGTELSYVPQWSSLQTYIVHVKHPQGRVLTESEDLQSWHKSFLPSSVASSNLQQERMVYSYKNVINGFAAKLTEEEVQTMKTMNGFVSACPERKLRKQTTRTPHFLGLHADLGFWKQSNFGKGVIIGVLDGGILPSHPSFSDEGMPPPPAKWKGRCEFNISACNNKLIGARTFNIAGKGKGVEPPNDVDGHGTHVASTAAGGFVQYADALGNAPGTAVGMAPYAHLAIYKVCFGGIDDCPESDLLAGFDAAVEDGVDVLSISIGEESSTFFEDIGASTIDRRIVASAKLGSGEEFDGETLFQPKDFPSTLMPLVYAGMNGKPGSALCGNGSLNGTDVKGKIVLCERGGGIGRIDKGVEVKNAGGVAMILMNDEPNAFSTLTDLHVLPATHISFADGLKIKSYINSTATPMATILFKGTVIGIPQSPMVTSFSSRGPNVASPGILKPDIIGPGGSILAAWPFPIDSKTDSKSTFNIISGTSMACPHLSGIAALLKSTHPTWSPAAIKSAIMTTADLLTIEGKPIVDQALQPADVFATGAGHVNPSRANAPGLIYDIQPDDYIPYLCGLGYKDEEVGILVHRPVMCSKIMSIPEGQLNYPSFSVTLGPSQTFTRTVTNVGWGNTSYYAMVVAPQGVEVRVKPSRLYFSNVNQKATYSVTFSRTGSGYKMGEFAQGYIKWVSTKYTVRSPISVRFE
ncbi:hypothetical protein EZV62_023546 [Acer yangbiense]|uniref:Inhibitor I9 domain-containing protein n=1 Tax=Acer yangbiense TaxID=1000413 RepID=A0A5C7H3H0_9ROSI|nr:hypothetical protein EZV62_023546 [Acer yangbiense]